MAKKTKRDVSEENMSYHDMLRQSALSAVCTSDTSEDEAMELLAYLGPRGVTITREHVRDFMNQRRTRKTRR